MRSVPGERAIRAPRPTSLVRFYAMPVARFPNCRWDISPNRMPKLIAVRLKPLRNSNLIILAHPLLIHCQDAAGRREEQKRDQRMSTGNTNLLLRNDTVLGVCEAIGQDFGFHPNWLRLTLASLFYFAPAAVIGTYVGLGLVVAFTRWVAPDREEQVPQLNTMVEASEEPLPIAA